MSLSLKGKTALITGGARGIGAAISTRFAEAGAHVVIANRTVEVAEELARSLRDQGFEAESAPFDDISRAGLTRLVDKAALPNGLDILVHNAGGCPWKSLVDLDEDTLRQTLDLNLNALFWLAQAAVPHMQAKGAGRILATSSVTGAKTAFAKATHYGAAKAGVNGFIKVAALELAPFHITVNGVEPGFIAKPGRGSLSTDEALEHIRTFVPLGEAGEPDDIAYAMLYLASPAAKYVTGQTITVDGGGVLPETGFAMLKLRGEA